MLCSTYLMMFKALSNHNIAIKTAPSTNKSGINCIMLEVFWSTPEANSK